MPRKERRFDVCRTCKLRFELGKLNDVLTHMASKELNYVLGMARIDTLYRLLPCCQIDSDCVEMQFERNYFCRTEGAPWTISLSECLSARNFRTGVTKSQVSIKTHIV